MKRRCAWVPVDDPLYTAYHDEEWGVPVHDDKQLFEFMILEGFQAGLSWSTVLRKREDFREAFDDFDPEIIARYEDGKIQKLLNNPKIIRNKLKIRAAVKNAQAFLDIQNKYGSFDQYIWQFTNYKTIRNEWKTISEIPSSTQESDQMSKALKAHGFSFVGSTICYAHMQATGMVNDHTIECFRYAEL